MNFLAFQLDYKNHQMTLGHYVWNMKVWFVFKMYILEGLPMDALKKSLFFLFPLGWAQVIRNKTRPVFVVALAENFLWNPDQSNQGQFCWDPQAAGTTPLGGQ